MIELSIGRKTPTNSAKKWSNRDLDVLARMIFNKDSYDKMAVILGRSVAAVKAMIEGRSGAKSYAYLQEAGKKLLPPLKPGQIPLALSGSFRIEPEIPAETPINAWPFPTGLKPAPVVAKPLPLPKTPAPKFRQRWTSDDEKYLVSLFKQGIKAHDMAQRLGRTPYGVLGRLSALGYLSYNKDENAYYQKVLFAKLPL